MSILKPLTVIGNRPQFVKAAVISRAIKLINNKKHRIEEVLVHTGQHYDVNMSEIFFKEMNIPKPDYNLGISNCSHGAMTGRMMEQIEAILIKEKPDVVMVYGDTNSTFAGALAAAKLKCPVAHVEAGLRSFNMNMPEEINRVLTDHISHFLFCPTVGAVNNLLQEGIVNKTGSTGLPIVVNVGDVMYDAALFYKQIARPTKAIQQLIQDLKNNYYLATVHRAENTDDPERLRNILEAFNTISENVPIIFPMHPRTRKIIAEQKMSVNSVKVVEPVGYFDMLTLLENSNAVFTDSGGLQKEAFFFRKPCIILRDETEWVELVENKFATLTGADRDAIIRAEVQMDAMDCDYDQLFYGNGEAGSKIIQSLIAVLS